MTTRPVEVLEGGPGKRPRVGDIPITGQEIREGILNPTTWPKIFEQNNEVWKRLGGCPLSEKKSRECEDPKFNYFPTSKDAILEWSDLAAPDGGPVASSKAEGAVIDVAQLPYLSHRETKERPTLLAFEVTGHVMLGILYNKAGGRGPEIHILNPWSMKESQQFKDVFELLKAKLGYGARKVIVVDVTSELEAWVKRTKKETMTINFQVFEKQGFCTLWVGIFAGAVIPFLPMLDTSVKKTTAISGTLLNNETLDMYYQVYDIIGKDWISRVKENIPGFNEERCTPTASAAIAVVTLAANAAAQRRGGKRKYRRQTKRRPLFRKRWTMKRRNLR
jgi:hypothetical protein